MFWPVWTSPNLNSMRWLGLFTNKTFREHHKLIFPHFIICIVSLAIVHPHFDLLIFPSAFYHPHFSIRILYFALYHPHFIIRHPPPSGLHFTETPPQCPYAKENSSTERWHLNDFLSREMFNFLFWSNWLSLQFKITKMQLSILIRKIQFLVPPCFPVRPVL